MISQVAYRLKYIRKKQSVKSAMFPDGGGVTFSGKAEKLHDTFTIKMGGESYFDLTVAELIPGARLVWLITDCNMPWYKEKKEWAHTKLVFDFSENNGETTVNFEHQGLNPNLECYKDCAPGWTHWIRTSLLSYLNTGNGVFRPATK